MRAISFGLVICIFVSLLTFSVYGLEVDGTIGNKEWKGAAIYDVIEESSQSNCNIDFATLFCIVDKSDYSVFLAFKYMSEDFNSLNNNSAIELTVNGRDCAVLYADGDEMEIDYDKFDAEYVFSFNEKSKETYCEMRLGIKYGVEEDTVLGIRIFDYIGRPSNYYEIKIFEVDKIVGENPAPSYNEVRKEAETETVTETATSHKRLSEDEKTTKRQYTTTPVIVAYTTAAPEKESVSEEKRENSTTVKESEKSKKESGTEKTTKKSEKTTKSPETESKQTDIVTEELISKAISDMEVKKARNSKTVGYSIASAVLVCAVFVAVLATLFKTSNEKKKENSDKDDF